MQHLQQRLRESRQQPLYLPEVCSFPENVLHIALEDVVGLALQGTRGVEENHARHQFCRRGCGNLRGICRSLLAT